MPRRPRRKASKYVRGGSGLIKATKTLGAPDRLIVKMPYFERFNLANAVSPGANYFWNMNSIWDPNRSGVGHNPATYAQWSVFYNRYRVIGVKVRANFYVNGNTGLAAGAKVYIYGSNETAQSGGYEQLEQSHIKVGQINPFGKPIATLTKYFNCQRITGRTLSQYMSDDRYQSEFGKSPLEVLTITAGAQNNTGGFLEAGGVQADVHLTYYVELFDRKNLLYTDVTPELRGPGSNLDEATTIVASSIVPTDHLMKRSVDPVV